MKTIKKLNGELLAIDKFNNLFKLNGNGHWVKLSNKEVMKLI